MRGVQVDGLDPVQSTAWKLLELCWRVEPDSRPSARQLLTWTKALLYATRAIEDDRDIGDTSEDLWIESRWV